MKVWFKGDITFQADLNMIKEAFDDHVNHFSKAVLAMPGMTKAEVEESGPDFITIRTNEGLMKRMNIKKSFKDNALLVDFEENYSGGKLVEVTSHYHFEFKAQDDKVNLICTIELLNTKGFLGFIYKKLSSKSIGNATLNSYKELFE